MVTDSDASDDPVDLRVEYESDPSNVDPTAPIRFSWRVDTERRGARQTAYRILVSRSRDALADGEGDVWDSGWVESERASDVEYDGTPLRPDTPYYWTVRIRDENGDISTDAAPATFATALDEASTWEGEWIAHQPGAGDTNGYRSQWQTAPDDAQWVQVDLGGVHEVSSVELTPAAPVDRTRTPDGDPFVPMLTPQSFTDPAFEQTSTAGFGFPVRYRVEGSTDPEFETATVLVDRTDQPVTNPIDETVTHEFDAESVRYVRVTATELFAVDLSSDETDLFDTPGGKEDHRAYYTFALASLRVRDQAGVDLAADGLADASSSVADDTWGLDRLLGGPDESTTASDSPLLRREFELSKPVASARIHVAGLGYAELYVNGERIGDEVLNPGWTQYDRRVLYSTYDIADRLHGGANAIGLWLGNGRFNQSAGNWMGFGSPRANLRLRIEHEDGTTRTIHTDSSWRATESPVLENDIYDGEHYDARREQDGWADSGFEDTGWAQAAIVTGPGGDLEPQRTPPIRVVETLQPEVVSEEDTLLLDVGQNMTGWLELTIDDPDAGDQFRVEHAEAVDEDGEVLTVDLMEADATDTYVARGDGVETYEPRFTYHGFRYAQISGPIDLIDGVTAKVVHTDFDRRGSFDCSSEDLTQVQHNAEWGLRSNAHSVPTDNPQRSERMGWTGDAQIAQSALLHNFDGLRFHEKWIDDHADEQARNEEHGYVSDTIPDGFGGAPADPTWSVTQVVIPWFVYQQYGDTTILERHYEEMRAYVEFWHSETDDGILGGKHTKYGDWLEFESDENTLAALGDVSRGTAFALYNTAYHYWTVDRLASIADALGKDADTARYEGMSAEVASAFNERFFDADAARYEPWTQTAQALPLYFGIVPEGEAEPVADNLAQKVRSEDGGNLKTGFLGTRPLINALAEHEHTEVAYEVVSQPERPGWVYMVRQGATTMWERWDSDDRVGSGMNSFNHSPFTLVSEWFYRVLAGLRVSGSDIEIAPQTVEDLDWAVGRIDLPAGELRCRWDRTDDGINVDVGVPWNTTATVRLPAGDGSITESDETVWADGSESSLPSGIKSVTAADGDVTLRVTSGSYEFDVQQ